MPTETVVLLFFFSKFFLVGLTGLKGFFGQVSYSVGFFCILNTFRCSNKLNSKSDHRVKPR